ncbi:hypothetical protein PoB_007260400 [Plakobranchus ocellatus]|uniref:Uncharacterized protein n=1 Tax=Plakobranchus ocellatus TaxID=259542 RepID=A0AAV4DPL6_9GAST|nr:hypothetical protein PoB_007260400 [Plakobranchus ocellatus]
MAWAGHKDSSPVFIGVPRPCYDNWEYPQRAYLPLDLQILYTRTNTQPDHQQFSAAPPDDRDGSVITKITYKTDDIPPASFRGDEARLRQFGQCLNVHCQNLVGTMARDRGEMMRDTDNSPKAWIISRPNPQTSN